MRDSPSSSRECTPISSSADEELSSVSSACCSKSIQLARKRSAYPTSMKNFKCAVCGDKSSGFHYEVLSCNGCKTFFRRTVASRRRYVCSRGGNCQFSREYRCSCRACRFSKCLSVGMKPELIYLKRGARDDLDSGDDDEEDVCIIAIKRPVQSEDVDNMKALDMIVHREMAVQTLRKNDLPFICCPDFPLEELLRTKCTLGTSRNGAHRQDIQVEQYQRNPIGYWFIVDLFLTVEFAKTFPEFLDLSLGDQKEIIYNIGGAMQIFSQSYYSVVCDSESIVFPDGINATQFSLHSQQKQRHEGYLRDVYCRPVDIVRQLNLSQQEFVMFKAIALFTIEGDLSVNSLRITKFMREELVSVFRKYLINQYGLQKGLEKLAVCLLTVSTFINIAENRRSYMFCIDLMERERYPKIVRSIYLKQLLK